MADGTVRGTFDLNVPAQRKLRDLRREGAATEVQMRRLGAQMDRVGGVQAERRLQRYTREVRAMGRDTVRTTREMNTAWRNTTREVERSVTRQERSIRALRVEMQALGRERATPTVEIRGLVSVLAQVELLHSRLRALDRQRSTPRVGLGGGFGGGGGRGGGGGIVRSLDVGPLSLSARAWLPLLGLGLPAGRAALGGAGALAGSAGAGAMGAGALGLTGISAFGMGAGLTAGVAVPMKNRIQEVTKAQEKYNETIQDFGRGSREAVRAKRELDQAFARAPRGTRQLISEARAFRREWEAATGKARTNLTGAGTNVMRAGTRMTSTLGPAATRVTNAIERESRPLGTFLSSSETRRFVSQNAAIFDENLASARRFTTQTAEGLMNVTVASRPFFREGTRFLDRWSRGWRDSTRDIDGTQTRIGRMVDHLRSWTRLGGSAVRLTGGLLSAGAPEGQSAVERLTVTLDRWDRWVRSNPRQTREFFRETMSSTVELGRALLRIATALGRIADTLTPVLDRFSQLTTLAGDLGLLNPGALAGAYGLYRGLRGGAGRGRGGMGPGGGRGGGMGGGPVTGGGAGGGGPEGVFMMGPGYGAERRARLQARRDAYNAERRAADRRGVGFLTPRQPGRLSRTARRLGGRARGPAGAFMARGGGAAAAAGRAYLPIAGLFAGLEAYGTPGTADERLQAALSSMTLGILPGPTLRSQRRDRGGDAVSRVLQNTAPAGFSIRQTQAGLGALTRRQQLLQAYETRRVGPRARERVAGMFGGEENVTIEGVREANRAFREEIRRYRRSVRELRERRDVARAPGIGRDIQGAFELRSRRQGPQAAMEQSVTATLRRMRRLRPEGAKILSENMLAWARQQARSNPVLQREYDRLQRGIRRSFSTTRQHVNIVNGQILTGSRAEWRNIRVALVSETERARQEASENFTLIQRKAIGSLKSMGFSEAQARTLVRAAEGGSAAARESLGAAGTAQGRSQMADPGGAGRGSGRVGTGRANATGGRIRRIPGRGLRDTVNVAPGHLAAPQELIVNRHSERDVNRDLAMAGKKTLSERVATQNRPHSMPLKRDERPGRGPGTLHLFHQTGGRVGNYPDARGALPGLDVLGWFLKQRFNLSVTSGLRPGARVMGSGNVSDHAWGGAIDVSNGVTTPQMDAAHGWLKSNLGPALKQLLYRTMVGGNHYDHIHVSLNPAYARNPSAVERIISGGGAVRLPVGGSVAGGVQSMAALQAPRSRRRGVPGALSQRSGDLYAAGLTRAINRRLGGAGAGTATGPAGPGRLVGTSVFGGPRDPGTGHIGYRGDDLRGKMAYAELGMGKNLGGLPYRQRARISYGSRSVVAQKLDIGAGGGPVQGRRRDLDLWHETARAIGMPGGLALAKFQTLQHGGRVAPMNWAGWHRRGVNMTVRRPTLFGAGEGGQPEQVTVRRAAPGAGLGGIFGSNSRPIHVDVSVGEVNMRSQADLDGAFERAAVVAARKLRKALAEADTVSDDELRR